MKARSRTQSGSSDGVTDPQISNTEVQAMAAEQTRHKTPHVDPEVLRAYSIYLSDWKQRMYTHMKLQREYM